MDYLKKKQDFDIEKNPSSNDSKKQKSISTIKYVLIIAFAIAIKCLQPLAIAGSKQSDGSYLYNKSTMVILVESLKLLFCSIFFLFQYYSTEPRKRYALYNLPFDQSLHFLIPAILYGASNTLAYIGMSYINPALFHVFGNTRILTAGVLYRVMMNKKQSDTQWLALILLTAGAILATPMTETVAKEGENNLLGLVAVIFMCTFSTCSSIYTEINYKKTHELSIFYQNIVLYSYGIVVNTI